MGNVTQLFVTYMFLRPIYGQINHTGDGLTFQLFPTNFSWQKKEQKNLELSDFQIFDRSVV